MNRKKDKALNPLGEPDIGWEHLGKEVWINRNIIKIKTTYDIKK